MSTMFNDYPDITIDSSEQAAEPSAKNVKIWKQLKKLNKQIKRHNLLLEKLHDRHKSGTPTDVAPSASKAVTGGKEANTTFLHKLGDAIVKAVPAIVSALVTAVLNFAFKGTMGSRSRKLRGSTV